MGRRRNEGKVADLAVSLAAGVTIAKWCAKNCVGCSTASRWARTVPGFRESVARHRTTLADRTIEVLSTRLADRLATDLTAVPG